MCLYRIYVLNGAEQVEDLRELGFPTDLDALLVAETLRKDEYAAEVWDGERLVGRTGAEFQITATD